MADDRPATPHGGAGNGAATGPIDFAGWGHAERIESLGSDPIRMDPLGGKGEHGKLSELPATAICGNDITSSCLYVSALCTLQAGVYAPIALAVVAVILYFFRKIYAEVGSALPLNGGAYNVLLNTTSKGKASVAACLTLLSYIATAVISAGEAMHYAHHLWHGLDPFFATIVVLGVFAILNVVGITESAVVATVIFIFHMLTLTGLVVIGAIVVATDPSGLIANWHLPSPHGIGYAIFFGFAAAMLGISGFESSANFIEEQKPGVFPKTLRNMWLAVAIFNPVISFLAIGLIPLADFEVHKTALLAHMADVSGTALISQEAGLWLARIVSFNAILVLCGAVLTGYVGVIGLVRRMSLDRCLPQVLLKTNSWRKTNHWIIFSFFVLCVSILIITGGDVELLGGVYTLSFLGVMALFAVGNMLLKVKRGRLPRDTRASWTIVVIALMATLVGIAGNLLMSPKNAQIFVSYFVVTFVVIAVMFLRVQILKVLLYASGAVVEQVNQLNQRVSDRVVERIQQINDQPVIFFTRGDDAANLNRAALYVLENEQTRLLKFVHVYDKKSDIPTNLAPDLQAIDHLYPQLRIDFVAVKGQFGPELIERLSQKLNVPKNYMFIGCPGDRFPHNISELGGVRLII